MLCLTSFVVPHSERMVLATSYQVLLIAREIDASNTHTMSTKQVNLLCEEVSDPALGHVLVSSSIQEDAIVKWDGLHAVNNVIRNNWFLVFNTCHLLSLLLKKSLVLFLSLADGWHRIVVELSLLFSWVLDVDDAYLALN